MSNRYRNRSIKTNDTKLYKSLFDKRGVKKIQQYTTPKVFTLSTQQAINISFTEHVWKMGDRYYKLAHQYYGDSTYWWLIAWYNQKPTEADVELGDIVYIPHPFEKILGYYTSNMEG